MNWLDIVLGIILAWSVAAGVARGFTRAIIGIVTSVLAIVLSIWFYGPAGAIVQDYVSHKTVANILGFFAVFGVVSLGGTLVGWSAAKMFKWAGLGWLDRIMGAGLGLLRWVLVAIVVVMILCAFTRTPPPQSVVESRVAPYVLDASQVLSYLAPKELKAGFDESYGKIRKLWDELWKRGAPAPVKL